jgi:hypothetical protein
MCSGASVCMSRALNIMCCTPASASAVQNATISAALLPVAPVTTVFSMSS